MKRQKSEGQRLRDFVDSKKIATLPELKALLGTTGTMTVFRRLKALGYRTSYSHGGRYYTLWDIPEFDEYGLWSCGSAWFSAHGNLLETAKAFVEEAEAGWTAAELEMALHVEVKHSLLKLFRGEQIEREMISGTYVYLSSDKRKGRAQVLMRQEMNRALHMGLSAGAHVQVQEFRAATILLFSLLDEKQRRLYAGLESQKLGRGGDRKVAERFGLDVHTVAKGRRELFSGEVESGRVRKKGGGRRPVEKKRRTSSTGSRSS